MTNAITIENLNFSYHRSTPILQDVNLRICQGDLMSIVGPNGGGKSTLVKLILGLLKPDSGTISVFGEDIRKVKQNIGYVPQFTRYDPQFPITVAEVVLMGKLSHRFSPWLSRKKCADEIKNVLEKVNLIGFENRLLSSLSGGEQQRVFIARALISQPQLLLLDEPTANIDTTETLRFYDLLKTLKNKMTILMVSHDLNLVADVVSEVICVNRHVAVHPVSAIATNALHDLYGMPVNLVHHCCHDQYHELKTP